MNHLVCLSRHRSVILVTMDGNLTSTYTRTACYTYNPEYLTTATAKVHYAILGTLYIISSILVVSLNGTFLITVKKVPRLRTMPCYILMMLSTTNLIFGVAVMPVIARTMIRLSMGQLSCRSIDYGSILGYIFGGISLVAVILISGEQYLAIALPYQHQRIVTKKRLLRLEFTLCTLVIVLTLIANFVPKFWQAYQSLLSTVSFAAAIAIVYCYYKLGRIVRGTVCRIDSVNPQEGKRIRSRSRLGKTGISVVVVFWVSYVPFSVILIQRAVSKQNSFQRTYLYEPAQLCASLTALWNPLIYFYRLTDVRKESVKLFVPTKQFRIQNLPLERKDTQESYVEPDVKQVKQKIEESCRL